MRARDWGAAGRGCFNRRGWRRVGISWRSCKHDGSDEVLLHPLPDFATIDDNFCYKDFTAKLQPQRR